MASDSATTKAMGISIVGRADEGGVLLHAAGVTVTVGDQPMLVTRCEINPITPGGFVTATLTCPVESIDLHDVSGVVERVPMADAGEPAGGGGDADGTTLADAKDA